MGRVEFLAMKTEEENTANLINSDLNEFVAAAKKLVKDVGMLGGLGFGTSFLQWAASISAIYLLILDRTNWRTKMLTTLLVPYIFFSLPSVIFQFFRFWEWIALIAITIRLFFPKEFPATWHKTEPDNFGHFKSLKTESFLSDQGGTLWRTMAAFLQAAVTTVQPARVDPPPRAAAKLRMCVSKCFGVEPVASRVSKCFGVEPVASRVSCSLHDDLKNLTLKFVDTTKIVSFSLAASALVVSGANAEGVPKRLTFDEIQSKTYMEVKGTGTANQCPTIEVKAEGVSKNSTPDFQNTKLMTRLTYTLDEIEGPFEVASDGKVKFLEKDGIDYAAVTVQLPGGERVPFLFTIKQLVASGKPESFGGDFLVPSYRGSSFLDPKGRGGSTGYDNAVALPARGDDEELAKENNKNTAASLGKITLSVTKSNPESREVIGVFESIQPSDTDLGAKTPKDVKIQGIWYAQLEE
ncbi:unnamed protein product [Arabidopsis arenosa]|uniref:33 kDa subunit of oxygen evolving system of photosystem II n=1 Tax=Arabidopsis arenosa TaxID=38785 RepID=A0A8S2AMS8_ARAAE|nr:unnamed protein product [Arabidopsis arenosa]